ncbi:hypothetical protein FB45DRAFT_913562 [Roridomyces roridus]|uniref:Mitochondrial outer membrane transport complex Sam37/metaxin N-terminal domain-containing protein n=1 Tax=Roridomyces roridus TaxID=1738132 RepID=A0AAD7FMV6_9AGAR|nr:hypothetical protein FB45DRAFT_913562 [Roridomyces roridus]
MSVLYIWPGQWGLPSIEPGSLAAVLYLSRTIPGQFTVSHCTNPDLSPSGTLPFLRTHDGEAWCSHIEMNLGDLVNYMLFSLPENWNTLIHPTLAYALPVPQRYYVPGRIRNLRRPRLESVGLWNETPAETKKLLPKRTSEHKDKIAQTFQRDKVLQTARDCLDIYQRLLGEKQYIFSSQMTTVDIILAAHVLVILKPPFTGQIIVRSTFGSMQGYSMRSLLPSLPKKSQDDGEILNWGWFGLAVGSVALYLATMGSPLRVVVQVE